MNNSEIQIEMPDGSMVLSYKGMIKLLQPMIEESFINEVIYDGETKGYLSHYRLKNGEQNSLFMTVKDVEEYAGNNKSYLWIDEPKTLGMHLTHRLNISNKNGAAWRYITNQISINK